MWQYICMIKIAMMFYFKQKFIYNTKKVNIHVGYIHNLLYSNCTKNIMKMNTILISSSVEIYLV